jgi:6-phosphogluconolactonase
MSQLGNGSRLPPDTPAGSRSVRVYEDAAALARAAADLFVASATRARAARQQFSVALSGGSTPRSLYTLLAAPPYRDQVDWSSTLVFWGDERCVPPDHPDSNYRMATETLLSHVPIPPSHIFRMQAELPDPAAAAARYEETLRSAFALAPGAWPRFDLILLGLGPDGHTASLFPHTTALAVADRLVVANPVEKLNTTRLTLTAPVINNAAAVVFLVAGADKADPLAAVLEGPSRRNDLPAQLVAPAHGELIWLVDRAAAAQLKTPPA